MKYFLLAIVFIVLGCQKDDGIGDKNEHRAVLVYMAANNSLNGDAYTNINQMEKAMKGISGKLLVYARLQNTAPRIYEIQYDTSNEIKSKVLKTYSSHNSSDPEVMKMVLSDMQSLVAARSYGLILWSHATAWHPDSRIRLRSFGDDAGQTMGIHYLKEVLPNNLDFLLFDACSMASIEVLYELKDKSRYTVASPAEVISVGMPYDKMLHCLYATDLEKGLIEAARIYYEHYATQDGLYQSATISVLDNRELHGLAQTIASFLKEQSNWRFLEREGVQRLDFAMDSPTAGFDLLDFYNKNFPTADISTIENALKRTLLYKAHTPFFNGMPIVSFSGLSMYIPHRDNDWVHGYYRGLDWYLASNARYIFDRL
ncbi:MAG: clostripain [Sphingobacterium sp.]|nr:clostripain [Sphingobacterium sp.]